MICFIGGAPRVGKSIAGRALAKAINGGVLSTDSLGLQRGDSVCFYNDPAKNTLTLKERFDAIVAEGERLAGSIRAAADDARMHNKTLIVEGVHLLPVLIDKFGVTDIRSVIIGSENSDLISRGMRSDASAGNWARGFDEAVLAQITRFVRYASAYLRHEADKFNLAYVERSNDFENDVDRIINQLRRS